MLLTHLQCSRWKFGDNLVIVINSILLLLIF